jgi:hypothetical protein
MITSSAERLASYPGKTTAAQNERNGDLGINSPGAEPGAANMPPQNPSHLLEDGGPWIGQSGTAVGC